MNLIWSFFESKIEQMFYFTFQKDAQPMKITRKGLALLIKITMPPLLGAVLIPTLYFAWQMGRPLSQPEFKGLTYYQFTEWRKIKYEESIEKYVASHSSREYTGLGNRMTACFGGEIIFERTFYPIQAFTYTFAALTGAKPDALHPLPEDVTTLNFLPKWWDTISHLFWYNTVHRQTFGGSMVDFCRFQPSVPTPSEFEALKLEHQLRAVH